VTTLSPAQQALVDHARSVAHRLYAGVETPHRSCGIAIAETFGRPTAPYQALRRGGLTGCGECGVLVGARLVLGELLGDPDPTGAVTPALREAIDELDRGWPSRLARAGGPEGRRVCNDLTAPWGDFRGPARHDFCTRLASEVAELLAEILVRRDAL
jgi:hypothetical protein